jgi:hypothetical protein
VLPSDLDWLASPEGRRVLAGLPSYRPDTALAEGERLRRRGLSASQVSAALTQSRLRSKAAERWGEPWHDLAHQLLFTPDGAEQATRPAVAALRAERFANLTSSSPLRVADLCCGIGLDALAIAAIANDDAAIDIAVDAYERDAMTSDVARANAAATGRATNLAVTHVDVTNVDVSTWSAYDALFVDPARRHGGRRLKNPEQWSPPLSWVLQLPQTNLGVKVAPGLDHDRVPRDMEFAVVSDAGVVVEAGLYRGALRTPGVTRSATVLSSGAVVTDRELPHGAPPVGLTGRYLHEPDGAIIRAGLVGVVVDQLDGWLIDPQIAYVSSDLPAASPLVASFEVHDVMPFSLKRLRAYLRERDVGQVVIKKRGSAVDVDDLRRQLRLDRSASGSRVLILTRIAHEPIVLITTPAN